MAAQFTITVRFLSDHYHGAAWPPAPATLFQALVAGGNTGAAGLDWGPRETAALEWLEQLPPPLIAARRPAPATPYRLFVPNNNLDKSVHSEVSGSKNLIKPETLRTSKDVHPRALTHSAPGEAGVIYTWSVPPELTAQAGPFAAAIDQLAARLTTLGWGVDLATAQASLGALPIPSDWERFSPATRGLPLQVPAPGTLANLNHRFLAFRGRITREGLNPALPSAGFPEVLYRSHDTPAPRPILAFDLRVNEDDWVTSKPWAKAMHVAAWLRHAAASALQAEDFPEECIRQFIQGHTDAANLGHRASFLPLPSIGMRHTDGIIRRALIAFPQELTALEEDAYELLRRKLFGWPIFEELNPGPIGYFDAPQSERMVYPFYLEPATVWESVTPVILHGFNAQRGQISIEKTERLLLQALNNAGYPTESIRGLDYQPAPFWGGAQAASRILLPDHLQNWPRLHVRVVFAAPVPGPISIGLGRHYGIGLLAQRD